MKGEGRPRQLGLECLEPRVMLATLPVPDPIVPNQGEANLLSVVQMHAAMQNLIAQNHAPVPFSILYAGGDAEPEVTNWKAGHPVRLDVDQSKATGKGGHDIQVEVNTELYLDDMGNPAWELRLNVDRIESTLAENVSIYIAFPFDAFNDETNLDGPPNLLMGFQTRLPGAAGTESYTAGVDGGVAPLSMEMILTTHILAGAVHDFQWSVETTGAENPLTFVAGEFDGDPLNPTPPRVESALAFSAYVADVPDQFQVDLSVAESALGGATAESLFDLQWTASDTSLVNFTYVEAESSGAASSPETADFLTELVADPMPTVERFILRHDEPGGTLEIDHDADSPIPEMTLLKRRSDGLVITAVASDVPTDVELAPLNLSGSASLWVDDKLQVDDNTLDMRLQVSQTGGFANTQDFLGYDVGYIAFEVEDAPDLTAAYDGTQKSFSVTAMNPGEEIALVEMILDDDGLIGADNEPLNLELPPSYDDGPPHHLYSLVDDGSQGTAVARAVNTSEATFDHDAPEVKETLNLRTSQDVPMQVYLKTGVGSNILPPPGGEVAPDPYVEVTCDIDDVPAGHSVIGLDLPMTFSTQTETPIAEMKCLGHIGDLNFGILLGDIPTNGEFDFRPEGSVEIKALDANATPGDEADDLPDAYGVIALHLSDVGGLDPVVVPWPAAGETFFPLDTRLRDARMRLDSAPSLQAVWDDRLTSTTIDLDTALDAALDPGNPFAYVEGFQLAISTVTDPGDVIDCDDLLEVAEATDASEHYALLEDVAGEQNLRVGVFGPDRFHFDSDDTITPSTYRLDFHLDPSRPFTAAEVEVDTNPLASGALGTYFGGDHVFGPLTAAYVPAEMHVESDLDPGFCTTGLFPPFFPIPSDIDQSFTVAGTQVFVHARDLPPRFCVNWDITGATTEIQVESTDLAMNPSETGLIEVLFQNPAGLPGGAALFNDGANPLRELRVRFDDAPSVTTTVTTGGPTHVNINTDNPAPFNFLGGLRLNASTSVGGTTLPTYPPLTGTEDHELTLIDDGAANKQIALQIVGLDELDFNVNSATSTFDLLYDGDTSRRLELLIDSEDGRFFPDKLAEMALLVNELPAAIDMSVDARGYGVAYTASSGIDQIRLGGPGILGIGPMKGRLLELSPPPPDDYLFNIDINSLPAAFSYDFDPAGSLEVVADPPVGSLIGRIENAGGFAGTSGLIGTEPIRDVRFRFDSVPSLGASWSSGSGMHVLFDTVGGNYLGGAQLALSSETTTTSFPAPSPAWDQRFAYTDLGGTDKKELIARVYGIDRFELVSTQSPRNLEVDYVANQDRRLVVDVDAAFDNPFLPDNDVDAVLTVTNVPQVWHLESNLATAFDFNGSGGLSEIEVDGEIGVKEGMTVHTTDILAHLAGLPNTVHFLLVPEQEGMAELTLSNPITQLFVELQSNTKILGQDYRHIVAEIDDIPANWNAAWGLLPAPHAILSADQPLGPVRLVLSKDVAANTPGKYTVFESAGSSVQYTDYAREIDRRYLREGDGDAADREAALMSRLDALYDSTTQLGNDEDHLIYRKQGGELGFLSVRGTGFECVAAQLGDGGFQCGDSPPTVNAAELNASLEIDFPGDHPFYVGMENSPGEFLTARVENVPDVTSVIVGIARAHVDFSSSPGEVIVYKGPLPQANDGQEALKVRVPDAPSFLHADWTLDLNGGVTVDSASEVEVALLVQNAAKRTVADFALEDLSVTWGFDTFDPELECITLGPVPVACSLFLNVIEGHFDIEASPEAEGFVQFYDFIGDAQDLSGTSPPHSSNQYVPRMSILADEITGILGAEAGIRMCILPTPVPLLPPHPGCIVPPPLTPAPYVNLSFGALSGINFDWWDLGGGVPYGAPDYIDQDPWHIWPLAHSHSNHKFPFGPPIMAAAVAPDSSQTTTPLSEVELARVTPAAIEYWIEAGFPADEVALMREVDIHIRDLPGRLLGEAGADHIVIDRDAAGWGWSVDSVDPSESSASAAGPPAMDLLTVLAHEFGHLLGVDHHDSPLMNETLAPGTSLAHRGAPSPPMLPPSLPIRDIGADLIAPAAAPSNGSPSGQPPTWSQLPPAGVDAYFQQQWWEFAASPEFSDGGADDPTLDHLEIDDSPFLDETPTP